jgi:hypothetical protein
MFPEHQQRVVIGLTLEGPTWPFLPSSELTILTTPTQQRGASPACQSRVGCTISLACGPAARGAAIAIHHEDRGMSGVAARNHEGALATQRPDTEGVVP